MKSQIVKKANRIGSFIIFSLVLVLGIVFLVFFLKFKQEIPENYVKTDAKILRIEEQESASYDPSDGIDDSDYEHFVFVEYSYNGKTFTDVEYPNYDSGMEEGQSVTLYLDPDDPAEFMGDPSGDSLFVIIFAFVILVGVAGIGYQIYQIKKEKEIK